MNRDVALGLAALVAAGAVAVGKGDKCSGFALAARAAAVALLSSPQIGGELPLASYPIICARAISRGEWG